MITSRGLLDAIKQAYPYAEFRYLHPSLYIVCTDPGFAPYEPEGRKMLLLQKTGLDPSDLDATLAASGALLHLITPEERSSEFQFLDAAPHGHHWIEFLANGPRCSPALPSSVPPIIHFYGFKGGQARSTVLSMLAKALADDGYLVLGIDADIEAPSLPAQFGSAVVPLGSTLLGAVQYSLDVTPQPVYLPKASSQGRVDLIACRPSDVGFDLDLAAFALHTSLNPTALEEGFRRIFRKAGDYDVVLIDHRSGISSSIMPLTAAFPGSVVVCLRLDEQSDQADNYFRVLLSQNPDRPGAFVSFSLDPEDTLERQLGRNRPRVDALLEILAKAIECGAPNEGQDGNLLSPDELNAYWIPWFHDRSFLAKTTPTVEGIASDNKSSLANLREVVGLQAPKRVHTHGTTIPRAGTSSKQLTSSGNTDQGLLIQTEALRKLTTPHTPYTYILGRKGTGKTRLVRTLIEQQLGTPLLVADDYPSTDAIVSSDTGLKDLAELLLNQHAEEKFWWILLDCVANGTRSIHGALQEWTNRIRREGASAASIAELAASVQRQPELRVYLIDGVETAFNSTQMARFVEGLFRFLGSVQSNQGLARRITIRLFIRTDLVRSAVENVEQQIEGRTLVLSWDTQTILNFALSRILELEWFRTEFASTTGALENRIDDLAHGAVSEEECNTFLLQIFPEKVRRNNLYTLTFLKDYFSEGIGESASFYPRIYDTFLRSIANPSLMGGAQARMNQIEEGRVAQPLIIAAHDYASKEYLTQVVAELRNLLRLADSPNENRDRVERLVEAFGGLPTPFQLEVCAREVHIALSKLFAIDSEGVRDAMQQMKRIGIFEDRPGYAGWWRAGRLFKNALGMKYVR